MLRLLFWETTIRCNLACAHCRRVESDETAHKDLSTAQAKDMLAQLAQLGREQPFMPVLVFSGGEPLCRDDLFDLIETANSHGITCALATNGTLIDSGIAHRIAEAGIVRVAVSLDGATAEVHNRLRQLEGSFERALEGVAHLRKQEVPFQINVTVTKHNAQQIEDVHELARTQGAVALHVFMLVPVGCGQVLAETDMLGPNEYEDMMTKIADLDARDQLQVKVTCGPHYERVIREKGLYKTWSQSAHPGGDVPGRRGHGGPSRGCLAGLGVLFVGHQGDVFPCGYLPVKCGNILEQSLSSIWHNNEDLARIRDSGSLEGKCGACGYKHVCGGCRGRAYGVTGNYMAAEPFCTYVPPSTVG
jgi:radical SAM protein with 4Fe4S-binding SPASM domain